jgi:ATP-dependent Clp protease adapter protein ClpS
MISVCFHNFRTRSQFTMFRQLIVVLLALIMGSEAFVSPHRRAFVYHLEMAGSEKEGGAAIAKPSVKIGQKTAVVTETVKKVEVRKKNQPGEPVTRREEEFMDAPLYKLMLLGDDAYDMSHVIERLCAVMEDLDEDAALTIYQAAQSAGKAMCGKYPQEHAEVYKEQLLRSDPTIYADLEDENS